METQKEQEANRIGMNILRSVLSNIYVRLPFLGLSIGTMQLKGRPDKDFLNDTHLCNDGVFIHYDGAWLIKEYQKTNDQLNRLLVHGILHNVFKHPFLKTIYSDHDIYDLACDILVEQILDEMNVSFLARPRSEERLLWYKQLEIKTKAYSPSKLMLKLTKLTGTTLEQLKILFNMDSHDFWPNKHENSKINKEGTDGPQNDNKAPSNGINEVSREIEELSAAWEEISHQIKTELEAFPGEGIGSVTSSLKERLAIELRRKYDYKKTIQKFLTMREVFKEDLDSFDPIYYTFGLDYYKNVALIEYLEYKEEKILDELVIVIDTSGSTYGEEVKRFLELTYNLVEQFAPKQARFKLAIIQADMQVQSVDFVKTFEEFHNYIKNFTLKGMGGTDFRPAFNYINKLLANKTLNKLKGVIYFTDGFGEFPKVKPYYESIAVFYGQDYNQNIPAWLQKIVIYEEDLNEY